MDWSCRSGIPLSMVVGIRMSMDFPSSFQFNQRRMFGGRWTWPAGICSCTSTVTACCLVSSSVAVVGRMSAWLLNTIVVYQG